MEQLVRVQKCNEDGTAQVLHVRQSACSGDCHKCSGCGAAQEMLLITAENPIGAKPGELVTIHSSSGPVLAAAAMLYGVPVGLFFLGYILGAYVWNIGVLAGGLAFGLGILLAVLYDRLIGKKQKTGYIITGYPDKLPKFWEKGDNDID